jgi:hypothetical protein
VWRARVPRRDRRLVTEHAGRAERRDLRLDDLAAGLHEAGIKVCVLTGGHGQVPAMHEHVKEAVPGVDRPRHRSVRDGTRRIQGPGPAERRRGRRRRRGVRSGGIGAEHVTVEAVPDVVDGDPGTQFGGPEVPGDQVIEQCMHVPAVARRGRLPLAGLDPGDNLAGLVERSCVQFGDVSHGAPRPWACPEVIYLLIGQILTY